MNRSIKAFTLIEVSIVLIILAVAVVAAVRGGSILDSYRIQNTVTDLQKFKAAVEQFRQTYNSLPGDMIDAETVWVGQASVKNGNGDGFIDTTVSSSYSEEFQTWRHLFLSQMVNFKATGLSGQTSSASYNTDNILEGDFAVSAFRITSSSSVNGGGSAKFNLIQFASSSGANGDIGIIKPSDAQILDRKIDDGVANTGQLRGDNGTAAFSNQAVPGTSTCIDAATGTYRVKLTSTTNTVRGCLARYLLTKF